MKSRRLQLLLLLASMAIIAVLTLAAGGMPGVATFNWCLACGELGVLDGVLNILLFVPLGASFAKLVPKRNTRAIWSAVAALLVSSIVELLQLYVVVGRDPSLSDISANGVGGLIGGLIGSAKYDPVFWRRTSWLLAAGVSAVLLGGEWIIAPHVPRETYFTQWLPERPAYLRFRGDLLEVALDGRVLQPGQVLEPGSLPPSFFLPSLTLSARILPGASSTGTSLITRLVLRRGEFLMLGRHDDDLMSRYRARSAVLRLRSPLFLLRGTLGDMTDSGVEISSRLDRRRVTLRVVRTADRDTIQQTFLLHAGRAWATLLPVERAIGVEGRAIDALWIGLWLFGVAYTTRRADALRRSWPPLGLTCLLTLAIALRAPEAAGASLLGAAAGVATGVWLSSRVVRRLSFTAGTHAYDCSSPKSR